MAIDDLNEPQAGEGPEVGNGKPPEKGSAGRGPSGGWVLYLLVLLVVIFGFVSYKMWGGFEKITVSPEYLTLALVGVVFHIARKYQKLRDVENFNWKEYGPDYFFRAFQACVYVVVIQNLVDDSTGWDMSMVALFVGLYIQKVEKAFDSLGERFGDMLSGVLGTAVQKLSPEERRKKLGELQQKFLDLMNKYSAKKAELAQADQQETEAQFLKIKEQMQKGKLDAAEMTFLTLEFRLKELGIE